MAEFLFEIFSEEIPARMQKRAGEDLEKLLLAGFDKAGLTAKDVQHWSGPRRLGFVCDLPARTKDISEVRKGPRVDAPPKAIDGFMRAAGLSSIDAADIVEDKKGQFYSATIHQAGQETRALLEDITAEVMEKFPWPKSMKSGRSSFRWVRPLQRLLCLFGGEIVPVTVGGITASNLTEGHRLHGRGPFMINSHKDYVKQLEGPGHVLLRREARAEKIKDAATQLASKKSCTLIRDEGLLEEVAGLAEWPVVLLGEMDPSFLDLPPEVIRESMSKHQKYFAMKNKKSGDLAPYFIFVANQDAPDGGAAIAAGNSRVLSARLSDAQFFMTEDARLKLIDYYPKLDTLVFHQKLGTMKDKADRIIDLSGYLASSVGTDEKRSQLAAKLAKADLVTQTVIEFPSLQGQIGRIMYWREGGDNEISWAIEKHYRPLGPSDDEPDTPISVTVALADKFDTLAGFWAIDEKPTGSKDPYALRRAALGIVRTIIRNRVRLNLNDVITKASEPFEGAPPSDDLTAFILERFRVYLRDQGIRYDVIDAVYALGGDDISDIWLRANSLQDFLNTNEGTNLLAGYRRAANILKAEAKKGPLPTGAAKKFKQTEEGMLDEALGVESGQIASALQAENYGKALEALSRLRGPIDAFFEHVTVNDDDPKRRADRLRLLQQIYDTAGAIANLEAIEG